MKKYETVLIMKENITEEIKNKVINKITDYLNTNGEVTKIEDMGLRKLAYEIRQNKKGYYYVIEFDAKPESILELERMYRMNEDILKFIVVRKEWT